MDSSIVPDKPGIYHDVPFHIYRKIAAVNSSYLKRLDHCPAYAKVESADTPATVFGRAFHALILEPHLFQKQYAIAPTVDKRTTAGKNTWNDFQAANLDKILIKEDDAATIRDMIAAVHSHPTARELLKGGASEATIIWQDKETGMLCKARFDFLPDAEKRTLIDVKTADNVESHIYRNAAVNYGYYLSAAMYLEGAAITLNQKFDLMAHICVEKEPPYRTEVYTFDDPFIDYGREEFHRLMRVEAQCRAANSWPHYKTAGADILLLPKYLMPGQEG
jgi:exodeoxyribonuclease VIII